jgi:diguanylate cyclase
MLPTRNAAMVSRYPESPERCAEALRTALRHMGQHAARWTPVCFTVWFEHAAGVNGPLSQELETLLKTQTPIDDDAVLRLHATHIADPDREEVQRISSDLQRLMSGVAENASSTGDSAGHFGDRLDRLSGALLAVPSPDLHGLLSEASSSARRMQDATAALVQQIDEGQREIDRLRRELVRARDEAMLDPLTGVLNRKGFDLHLATLLTQAALAPQAHSLVMIDIDHFKNVNDSHGHLMGDQVIVALAQVLRRCAPQEHHLVARYGGEEFAILLPRTPLADGLKLAEAVRQGARAMKFRDRRTQQVVMTVTVSAGVAAHEAGEDASSWIARSDAALYKSKQGGRDRVSAA